MKDKAFSGESCGLDWTCGCGEPAVAHVSIEGMQFYFCKECFHMWTFY